MSLWIAGFRISATGGFRNDGFGDSDPISQGVKGDLGPPAIASLLAQARRAGGLKKGRGS